MVEDFLKNIREGVEKCFPSIPTLKFGEKILKSKVELEVQPFQTNYLLEDLLRSQTPKWVNIIMLILVALTLGISIWTLLYSYGIV